jgi:hypothetical protein
MRRLRRWLLAGIAALSFVVALVTAIAWVRSYFIADQVIWHLTAMRPFVYMQEYSFDCSRGGIQLRDEYRKIGSDALSGGWIFQRYVHHDSGEPNNWPLPGYPYFGGLWGRPTMEKRAIGFGFVYIHSDDQQTGESRRGVAITFPIAIIFFSALILLIFWLRREMKRRRASMAGCCPKCGYDLRATPGRCPECGEIPPKKEVSAT